MSRDIILDIFCKFCLQKKRGFTLAEALIITVMTAFCLLPILGTMQNGQILTQKYDHKLKMRQIARSRLNSEIAKAAFDHKAIDLTDQYNYIVYFDRGEEQVGCEDNSKLIELPKTTIKLDDLLSINNDNISTWNDKTIDLLGLDPLSCKPYLKIVHFYKTSVEIKDKLKFSNSISNIASETITIDSPNSLLGIVVKTALIKSEDNFYNNDGYILSDEFDELTRVEPVTLFSLINLPVVSDEYIWLADALEMKLYSIDPVSKVICGVLNLPRSNENPDQPESEKNDPYRPWHIAVHPSCKILAVMKKQGISLINIDSKSLYYGKSVDYPTNMQLCNPQSSCENAYKDGGLAFRPDGQFLFFTSCKSVGFSWKLNCLKLFYDINYDSNSLNWSESEQPLLKNPVSENFETFYLFNLNVNKVTEVISASDGFLYVATVANDEENGIKENMIYRFPMYQNSWVDWKGEMFISVDGEIESIDVSNDGTKLAVIFDNKIKVYDTRNRELLNDEFIISEDILKHPFKVKFLSISDSSQNTVSENNSFYGIVNSKVKNDENNISAFFNNLFKTSDVISLVKVFFASEIVEPAGGNIVVSPDNREVVINDRKKPCLYFTGTGFDDNTSSLKESDYNILKYKNKDEELRDCSDMSTTKRDILAVAFDDNIQLYDLNRFNKLEEECFTLTASITSLAMNPEGDMILGGYGQPDNNSDGNHGFSRFHLHDLSIVNPLEYGAYAKKIVFDDRTPNMAFELEYPGRQNRNDAFWNINFKESDWSGYLFPAYDRYDFDLDPSWKRLDLIGLPKGGALVLYGQLNGSSMIEWIGRRNWAQDYQKGKYSLFARWTNIKQSTAASDDKTSVFPPLFSKKLAISPDMGILAVLSGTNTDDTRLKIYDFNSSNYGSETQIEGMIIDYRETRESGKLNNNIVRLWPEETGESLFGEVANNCGFVESEINVLNKSTTKYDSWLSFNNYPANYFIASDSIRFLAGVNRYKVHYNKRFFGYIRPEYNVPRLQSLSSEDVRYFYNHDFIYGHLEKGVGFISPESKTEINLSSYTTALLQIDQTSDLGGMYLGTFIASPSATQVLSSYFTDLDEKVFNGNFEKNHYVPKSSLVGWESLKSEQTYILKNIPSFIGSFEVSSSDNVRIDINSSSMLFSKDKAKPILYLVDNSHLFAYYNKAVIRLNLTDSIITNPVISGDGQKLIFGISETNNNGKIENYLKVLNISSPTINLFNDKDLVSVGHKESYLGLITKIFTDKAPYVLASKPFNSISSSKIGGEFKTLEPVYPEGSSINVSNNSIAVASGGIYLYADNKDVYLFDPFKNSLQKKDNLIVESCFSAVAAYDDVLYFFGNFTQDNLLNPTSGRVQSYDVNSNKRMKSLLLDGVMPTSGYSDEYQVSMSITNSGNNSYPSNFGFSDHSGNDVGEYIKGDNVYNSYHAFVNNESDYAYSKKENSYIKLTYDIPLTVNQIRICNKTNSSAKKPVISYKLMGKNNDGYETLSEINIGGVTNYFPNHYSFNINPNLTPYKKFKLYLNSTENGKLSSGNQGVVNLVQLFRTGVKRLTPSLKNTTLGSINKDDQDLFWNRTDRGFTKMKWASNVSEYFSLKDIYIGNETDGNNWFKVSDEGWNTNVAKPWITVSLSLPEAVCAVRYANDDESTSSSSNIVSFRLYGSNNDLCPTPNDIDLPPNSSSDWIPIKFSDGSYVFTGPKVSDYVVDKTFITAEVSNSIKYKHYLFQVKEKNSNSKLRLIGFELYSKPVPGPEQPSEDYLTILLNDNLVENKAGEMAACSTPYGIVVSGGRLLPEGSNMSSNKCFLY